MNYNYDGFLIKQREGKSDIEFITFIANAKDVYNWSHADSILIDASGVQRKLTDSRWKKIVKFFNTNDDNIIPNSIIIACDESIRSLFNITDINCNNINNLKHIEFDNSVRNKTYIIDGQHRLKGMSELTEDLPVVVSLFLGISSMERAFQFITINNKSHKVPTDNIKALVSNFNAIEEDTLKDRLATATITAGRFATLIDVFNEDKESPFYKRVDWDNNRTGIRLIKPLALENSMKVMLKVFPNSKNEQDDVVIDIIYNTWNPILSIYNITDHNIKDYINLFKKATVQAISEYIADRISNEIIFSTGSLALNPSELAKSFCIGLFTGVPSDFWKNEWDYKSLDSDAGRKFIIESTAAIKRNLNSNESWDKDIKLVKDTELS